VQVDVSYLLQCLRGCVWLSHLTLKQYWMHSRESSIGVPGVGHPEPKACHVWPCHAMPALQTLEIPMSPNFLDLRACPRLQTLHVTDAFDFQIWSWESPTLARLIVSLRELSKRFKMPPGGQWATSKEHSTHRDGHWHRQGSYEGCQVCSPIHTIQLGPSGSGNVLGFG
jgi:hypothetical protein